MLTGNQAGNEFTPNLDPSKASFQSLVNRSSVKIFCRVASRETAVGVKWPNTSKREMRDPGFRPRDHLSHSSGFGAVFRQAQDGTQRFRQLVLLLLFQLEADQAIVRVQELPFEKNRGS